MLLKSLKLTVTLLKNIYEKLLSFFKINIFFETIEFIESIEILNF